MDDRISHLPESIVHHILSFLTSSDDYGRGPIELVRMSVLSKTWFHLTSSFPFLDFRMWSFTKPLRPQRFYKYFEYTTSVFSHHNLTLQRLILDTALREPAHFDIVDRCLGLLLRNGVKELLIDMHYPYRNFTIYRLPDILLSVVSVLQSLTIRRCHLPSSFMLHAGLNFKSLLRLELEGVPIDDEAIKYLSTICPLLRDFFTSFCPGLKSFCVHGHQNLQQVRIEYGTPLERLDIEAPNLSRFLVRDWNKRGKPRMNLASCKKLASVSYNGYPLSDVSDFLSNFPFLQNLDLALDTNNKGNNLKLSSNSLRTLVLSTNYDLEDIELSTPSLGLFVYTSYVSDSALGISHLPYWKACMQCYPNGYINTLWFQKLRLFLDKKNGFKALNLYICTYEKFIVLEKLIELPPYELEHIELHFEHEESSDHTAFVDAVLWCFRPRSLTLRSSFPLPDFEEQSDLVKFTYKKLLEQEDQGHTNIQILSPSSSKAQKQFKGLMLLPVPVHREEKAVSFIKEEVAYEEAG